MQLMFQPISTIPLLKRVRGLGMEDAMVMETSSLPSLNAKEHVVKLNVILFHYLICQKDRMAPKGIPYSLNISREKFNFC